MFDGETLEYFHDKDKALIQIGRNRKTKDRTKMLEGKPVMVEF